MNIGPDHVAALRAVITGDDDALERWTSTAGAEDDLALGVLVSMAFLSAAQSRFAANWTTADVIRFVAQIRMQYGFDDLVPSLAEALLTNALGGGKKYEAPDGDANAYTQMVLLQALANGLSDDELAGLTEESSRQADSWLQRG